VTWGPRWWGKEFEKTPARPEKSGGGQWGAENSKYRHLFPACKGPELPEALEDAREPRVRRLKPGDSPGYAISFSDLH
jgi:hypothetical protein